MKGVGNAKGSGGVDQARVGQHLAEHGRPRLVLANGGHCEQDQECDEEVFVQCRLAHCVVLDGEWRQNESVGADG